LADDERQHCYNESQTNLKYNISRK